MKQTENQIEHNHLDDLEPEGEVKGGGDPVTFTTTVSGSDVFAKPTNDTPTDIITGSGLGAQPHVK